MHDIAIVGGRFAWLSADPQLARASRSAVIIDNGLSRDGLSPIALTRLSVHQSILEVFTMKPIFLALTTAVSATPVIAQDSRQTGAHMHGISKAEIAVEHGTVEISILSPGADIVGFEYAARSDAEKDAVEAAIRVMLTPENIVTLPDAATCRLAEVLAHLSGNDDHDEGGEHADGASGDHDDTAEHSEFQVRYVFVCEDEDALTTIGFPFFDQFPNAQEVEAQYVTETGAGMAEITRGSAVMALQ